MLRLLFIGIGAAIIASVILSKKRSKKALETSLRAIGKVVDYQKTSQKQSIIYLPKITFQTERNEVIEFVSANGLSFKSYQIGDEVEVYYNPNNPDSAGICSEANSDSMSFIAIITGIGMILGGIFYR
ncbi:MAG: DUF3592 domain-containing protein [Acidobacteriota bacterium]